LWDDVTQTATACGCATEKICDSNATCIADITTYYQWCENNVPGTKVIVVGVGTSATICSDQLLVAAGGDPTNVYNPSNWNQLQSLVQTITATACTADDTPCPDCCGLCTCGQCIPPPACQNASLCSLGVLDPSTSCCTTQTVTCPAPPCMTGKCFDTTGCQYSPMTCPPDQPQNCIHYECDNSTVCTQTLYSSSQCIGQTVPPCNVSDPNACNDNSACTQDSCDPTTGCQNIAISCEADTACISWRCQPSNNVGCINTTKNCDDGNACTMDTCDSIKGCLHVNITCPNPSNPCLISVCDPQTGCGNATLDCTTRGYKAINCTVPACNASSGCYNKYICAAPPPTSSETNFPTTVVLASALTTAAVAGIIIACVIIAGVVGGGAAVAIAQVAVGGGAVVTASNPLYAGAGTSCDNPLNQN